MTLLSRLERLEKRAASLDSGIPDMDRAFADAMRILAERQTRPPATLPEQIAELKLRIARCEQEADEGADWLSRDLAAVSAECARRTLAMLEADFALLRAAEGVPEGDKAHG